MEVTFADKLGTEDRTILSISVVNGELELHMDKPETLGWQELIYFIKYVIAQALADESDWAVGDIFQWLGAHGFVAEEIEKTTADLLAEAKAERLRRLKEGDELRLDRI